MKVQATAIDRTSLAAGSAEAGDGHGITRLIWCCQSMEEFNQLAARLPDDLHDYLLQAGKHHHFTAARGQSFVLFKPLNYPFNELLVIGLGDVFSRADNATGHRLFPSIATIFKRHALTSVRCIHLQTLAAQLSAEQLTVLCYQLALGCYRFTRYDTSASDSPDDTQTLVLLLPAEKLANPQIKTALQYSQALILGMQLSNDLANAAPNHCQPTAVVAAVHDQLKGLQNIAITHVDDAGVAALNMGAFHAVGRGSPHGAQLLEIDYLGKTPANDPLSARQPQFDAVLIGKGVTFDSGGITLKKADGMQHMRYDMTGAACLLGLIRTLSEAQVKVNVKCLIGLVENLPDGKAYRPGDILTSHSGQTIEVISTDAEGRLVMCDLLSYGQQFQPKYMLDVATLTGAAISSLGHIASLVISNDQQLTRALEASGDTSCDPVWCMPQWQEYKDTLASPHADMRNTGVNSPGAITAGMFLSCFVGDIPWAHLDVAGTAFQYGTGNSTTGRPLLLLFNHLLSHQREESQDH